MEKCEISKNLLKDIIYYVENAQEVIDSEWGTGRSVSELIKDGEMPNLYFDLKKTLNECS